MDKYEAAEIIEKQLCKELIDIAENIHKNQAMSSQELDRLNKIYHTMKSKQTSEAMYEASEYEGGISSMSSNNQNGNGNSGYRGRAMNGRFVSRESANNSYAEGYSRGYSEAMNQMNNGGNSGHYPMMPYDSPRRW